MLFTMCSWRMPRLHSMVQVMNLCFRFSITQLPIGLASLIPSRTTPVPPSSCLSTVCRNRSDVDPWRLPGTPVEEPCPLLQKALPGQCLLGASGSRPGRHLASSAGDGLSRPGPRLPGPDCHWLLFLQETCWSSYRRLWKAVGHVLWSPSGPAGCRWGRRGACSQATLQTGGAGPGEGQILAISSISLWQSKCL